MNTGIQYNNGNPASSYYSSWGYCKSKANELHDVLAKQYNTVNWVVANLESDQVQGFGDKNYNWHIQWGKQNGR